jgi:hypothetical protein
MSQTENSKRASEDATLTNFGDNVMKELGRAESASEALGDDYDVNKVDPDEVGRWITAIGKAVLAIFKA